MFTISLKISILNKLIPVDILNLTQTKLSILSIETCKFLKTDRIYVDVQHIFVSSDFFSTFYKRRHTLIGCLSNKELSATIKNNIVSI